MSERLRTHSQRTPSQEPLPVELAEIETELAQLSLPASTINRDELLYCAGWAAAEVGSLRRRHGGMSRWLWPATSAALAATVLMLLFAPWAGTAKTPAPGLAGGLTGEQDTNLIVANSTIDSNTGNVQQRHTPRPSPKYAPRQSRGLRWEDSRRSLLTLRHRALMRQLDSPPPELAFDDAPTPPSKTSRELLQELLPELKLSTENNVQQDKKHWTWPKRLWKALS